MKNWFPTMIATGLYTGYSPTVPGTVGTIPAWLIAWFLIRDNTPALAIVTIVTFFVSVWSASAAEHVFGHDSRKIVIDEWAGMFVALLFVPVTLTNYLIAFVAFRAFDVIKLPPAAQSERLPIGWGVTMDDIVAGIQANVFTQIVIWIFLSRPA
jgi:phosphatidylglycerophosphatase A